MATPTHFSDALATAIAVSGLNQATYAEQSGITPQRLSSLLHGDARCGSKVLTKLCTPPGDGDAADLTTGWLRTYEASLAKRIEILPRSTGKIAEKPPKPFSDPTSDLPPIVRNDVEKLCQLMRTNSHVRDALHATIKAINPTKNE